MSSSAHPQSVLSAKAIERQVERLLQRVHPPYGKESAESLPVLEEALDLVERAPETTRRTQGLAAYTRFAIAAAGADPAEVDPLGREALDLLEGAAFAPWRGHLLLKLGALAGRWGRLEEARQRLEEGLATTREHGLDEIEGPLLHNLGMFHLLSGDLPSGLELLKSARRAFRQCGSAVGEGTVLAQVGSALRMRGDFPGALAALVESVELLEGTEATVPVATAHSVLSSVYAQLGIGDEAVRCAAEAVDRLPSPSQQAAQALATLAQAHRVAGDPAAAREAAERSLAACAGLHQPSLQLNPLCDLGLLELEAGRVDEAEQRFLEGLAILEQVDAPDIEVELRLGMAWVLEARGQVEEAEALAASLVAHAERIGERGTLIELNELLARLGEAGGDAEATVRHLKRVIELKADLFSRETDVRVRNIQVAHELRREQRRSAEILQQLTRRVIESQEEERRRVASDLHDDLGQRVALLAVELDLLRQSAEDEPRADLERLTEQAQAIADRIRSISHGLHPAPLARLGIVRATEVLCEELARVHDADIAFESDVSCDVPDDVALGLYRIVQEGLGNAMRHAGRTAFRVVLDGGDDRIRLHVEDGGCGFDPHALANPGIGLAGMRERAGALGGRFTLHSRPGRGTRIEVDLPLVPGDSDDEP